MGSRLGDYLESNRKRAVLFFILLAIFGSWLNAQGGWVKDFSYNRSVTLPFLFAEYHTTGFVWYLTGVFDDLLGVAANLVGISGFKRLIGLEELNTYRRKYFVVPLAAYLIGDFAAFLNFNSYYIGTTSISRYGELWNIYQYFILIPSLILMDILLLMYSTKKYGGFGSSQDSA